MLDRNPLASPDPSGKQTDQPYPGTDDDLEPGADHGESSYTGAGRLEGFAAAGFVYLASADARYISGEVLAITGKTSSR